MEILDLFSGIGGNRFLWGNNHEITAVEYNKDIAAIYQKRFPKDTVIVGDAHEYLENNHKKFDFIWASPECPTHSRMKFMNSHKTVLPDMRLYSIIIFLQTWFKGKWVVENVIPYYEALIKPTVVLGRHNFWSNFYIEPKKFEIPKKFRISSYKRSDGKHRNLSYTEFSNEQLCELHNIDWDLIKNFNPKDWKGHDCKRQILRNCVLAEIGQYILKQIKNQTSIKNFMEAL